MWWPFGKKLRLKFQDGSNYFETRLKKCEWEDELIQCRPVNGWATFSRTGDLTLTADYTYWQSRHESGVISSIGAGALSLTWNDQMIKCKAVISRLRLGKLITATFRCFAVE